MVRYGSVQDTDHLMRHDGHDFIPSGQRSPVRAEPEDENKQGEGPRKTETRILPLSGLEKELFPFPRGKRTRCYRYVSMASGSFRISQEPTEYRIRTDSVLTSYAPVMVLQHGSH